VNDFRGWPALIMILYVILLMIYVSTVDMESSGGASVILAKTHY